MPYFGASPSSTLASADLNGQALILDADADTTITADTDDQIDIRIAGADDFRFTANTLTALSGSTVAIASGATIANSGTATGFTDLTAIADGSAGSPSIANSGDTNTGVFFPAADTVGITAGGTEQFRFGSNPIPGGGKNLVQNGAMTVMQRGSTAVAADSTFAIDRYSNRLIGGGPARWTVTQDTTVPSGKGFGYSMKIDVTTVDSSISTNDYHGVVHTIEAQNLQHLNFNNAASKSLTLTFWARAKKAGLHGGAIYNNDANRSLVFSWTAVSDEWQKVTVPIPAETSAGGINNDTGAGLSIYWSFSGGKYMASNTGAWVAGAYLSVTDAVNDFDSTSNDFYLTGVQLEIGDLATDFAHEDYGTTLNKCLRYFEKQNFVTNTFGAVGFSNTTTSHQMLLQFTEKRATGPTVAVSTATDWEVNRSGTDQTLTALAGSSASKVGMTLIATVSSGLTTGEAAVIRSNADTNYVTISSEL